NTLTVVCDTHRQEMVAAQEALEISERRIVIDHHRRAADFVENPLLTYLEPTASSTSELVTELVQYAGVPVKLSKAEATGIYAGIVLDTKNFIQQTGARTFEAAAFLRRAGADKQLFIETFDSIQLRAKMVFEASRTEGIAISVAPEGLKDMMALAAQSADMLISNEDIEAAFVLYSLNDGGIGVSARSKGKVNVQVVMEALGGGGHRTVAGAQLQGMTIEEAKQAILEHALKALHSAEQEEE
ncbi:MAG: DHHA1 domain-containing protein, partial [Veillonella sp.]|nr:DHHA1 domain-containing protein [Veillonella sp.]